MNTEHRTTTVDDVIEATSVVSAPVDRIWEVVSLPGWWIVDCDESALDRLRTDTPGGVYEDDAFRIETLHTDEPHEAAFSWSWTQDPNRPVTRVVVRVEEGVDAATVRVTETGLSTGGPVELLAAHYEENAEGWPQQLALARSAAEARAAD
ncbi:SRPBCC family protein [Phycicoccus flavus]|uniref:hypothetical protein n=1 Tax=Phycicoccus flavus TaxID=2502783 RepID=UPI000FEBD1A7|nr:hypothetical protein [Phycicoccus flavus]NHA69042.1 hypothetical protein [Phycicoccus flavus]